MGLKEWGQGLELLTDYYYRYAKKKSKNERWFTTGAIIGEKKKSGGTYPVEIDLIAFLVDNNCKIKQIHSVQCKEAVNGSIADGLLKKFSVDTVKTLLRRAEKKGILTKVVSYVKINDPSKKKLERVKGLELLPFGVMTTGIGRMKKDYRAKKRKGYEQETVGWFYGSMYDIMMEKKERKRKRKWQEANRKKIKEKSAKWYANNRERVKEYGKKWREENPEKERERTRKYREKNPEKNKKWREENRERTKKVSKIYREKNYEQLKEKSRKYYEKNREKIRERVRKYHEENLEKIKEYKRMYREKYPEKIRKWREENPELV